MGDIWAGLDQGKVSTPDTGSAWDSLESSGPAVAHTGSLYHYRTAEGVERFSKDPPPPGSKPWGGYSATEGQANFTAGVGKGMYDTGRGIAQLGAQGLNKAGLVSDQTVANIQSDIDESRERDKPLMGTTGGKIGDITGQAVPLLALGPEGLIANSIAGAGLGFAQPTATGESRTKNTAVGAAGGLAGGLFGKLLSPFTKGMGGSNAGSAAVDLLEGEGIPMSVAQRTGSKMAQHIERASSMTSDDAAEFAGQQGAAFNRAVLKRIGADPEATAATPDVLAEAKANMGAVMDNAAAKGAKLSPKLEGALQDVEGNLPGRVVDSHQGPIARNIADLRAAAEANNGVIPGKILQRVRSNLGALQRDPQIGDVAGDLRESVDDAIHEGLSGSDAKALAIARQQYRALKQIEPAVDADGNISPRKLMASLSTKNNRNQTLYGKGDQSLVSLARAARQVLPDNLGNSGTAERMLPAVGAIETLGSGEPLKAGAKLVAGKAGLNAAGRVMRHQGIFGKIAAEGVPGGQAIGALPQAAGFGTTEEILENK